MSKITITKKVDGKEVLVNTKERTNVLARLNHINALYEELQEKWGMLYERMYWKDFTLTYVDSNECSRLLDFDDITFRNHDFERLMEAEDDGDDMYIGLTAAYFAEDDGDNIYAPDYWLVTDDPDELAECKGLLTYDGVKRYEKWAKAYRMNEYQRTHSFGYEEYFKMSKWDIYYDLIENYTYKTKEEQE